MHGKVAKAHSISNEEEALQTVQPSLRRKVHHACPSAEAAAARPAQIRHKPQRQEFPRKPHPGNTQIHQEIHTLRRQTWVCSSFERDPSTEKQPTYPKPLYELLCIHLETANPQITTLCLPAGSCRLLPGCFLHRLSVYLAQASGFDSCKGNQGLLGLGGSKF